MKRLVAHLMTVILKTYFRNTRILFGKNAIYKYACRQYVNWRNIYLTVRTLDGVLMRCGTADILQSRIIYFGEWEPNLTAFVKRRLAPGDGFVDVGANTGYYSLLAAKCVEPGGYVVAIEASPSIYNMLKYNINLNESNIIRAVNVAASDRDGVLEIYKADAGNIGATTTIKERNFVKEDDVRSVSLISIMSESEASKTRLIKIDIEGAEFPVLIDIYKNIAKFPEHMEIFVEISPFDSRAVQIEWENLLQSFFDIGFNMYEIVNDYSDIAYLDRTEPIRPKRIECLPDKQCDIILSRERYDIL